MLHRKQSPRASPPQSLIKMPLSGANGSASAASFTSPPTSKASKTLLLSSKFSPSVYIPGFCPCRGRPSRSDKSSNTSTPLVKYLHPWGPMAPATTAWENLNFGWDFSWSPIRNTILLQQECGLSRLMLSKPWMPSPKEPPQEKNPSETSPGSPSSSSSGLTSTERAAQILPTTCLDSRTSNSSLYNSLKTTQLPPTISLHKHTSSVSSSRCIITESKDIRSGMEEPSIPKFFQWWPCVAKWHIFDVTAPPSIRLF